MSQNKAGGAASNEFKKTDNNALYESIVDDIRKMYNGNITELEAHAAAKNLIEFYRILLE